jgi:hypothetical protein
MKTHLALAAGLLVLTPVLAQSQQAGCKVTLSQYNQLRTGMSYHQVIGILGCEGGAPVYSQLAPHTYARYSWDGRASGASMSATFRDERLTEKSQSGLQ